MYIFYRPQEQEETVADTWQLITSRSEHEQLNEADSQQMIYLKKFHLPSIFTLFVKNLT